MSERDNPKNEGHTREWQDRARVVLNSKDAVNKEASPNQSPGVEERNEDTEGKNKAKENRKEKDDRFY